MSDPKLLTISGSLRAGATNRKLLAEAARLFGPAEVTEADLNLPLYDGDDEQASGIPAAVQTLADQIGAADAVIISTPEYNGAPSGVLKNALDWVSRTSNKPWQDKPVAIMSAAAGRAERREIPNAAAHILGAIPAPRPDRAAGASGGIAFGVRRRRPPAE
ncbi:NAD(P)H-dependent oxidoreductase [Phaeobacter sp. BS34]